MTPEDIEAVRQVIREELRAAGLRRPMPDGLGLWGWDAQRDAWVPRGGPAASPPVSPAA